MRFVPHRNISFQYSLDEIDSEYDSGYSSDSSLETPEPQEKSIEIIEEKSVTSYIAEDFQITKISHILDDLKIQERFHQVSEASILIGQATVPKSLQDYYYDSISKLRQTHANANDKNQSDNVDNSNLFTRLRQQDEQEYSQSLDQHLQQQDREIEIILKQLEEERRRAEEERRRKEEEARRRAEEERRRKEEEERRKNEEEEERKKQQKLEEERKLKEAEELLKKKAAEELKAAEEARLKKIELEKVKLEEERKLKLSQIGQHSNLRIQREFLKYKQDISDIKQNIVEPLQANKELKQLTNKVRRKINPKFGQLTDSRRKLLEISNEILVLVNEARGLHELSYKFILNFIAKELIKQAEVEVIVNPQHSVSLGRLALNLMQVLPDLQYYLLARFYKKCPYLIGFTCAVDTEEGRERMGWRRSNNKWEEESKYNERVGGIATLYSVISRLNIGNGASESPISISKSWVFLSRMLNTDTDLLLDVHYILIANWWDACCKEFLQTYGAQGTKLLQLVASDWLAVVEQKKFSGYVRLRMLAEDWIHGGRINSFKEMDA